MRYIQLGKTNLQASTIAFGGYAIGGRLGKEPPSEEDALGAVRAAYEEGVNLFITATGDGDGLAEQRIGAALSDVRGRVILATKTGPEHQAPRELELMINRSLQNFRTDYIDLFMLDLPHPRLPPGDLLTHLDKLREQGKIRTYGVCRYGARTLAQAIKTPTPPCCVELSYNLLFRALELEIQPLCVKQNVSILCRAPLLLGLLTGRYAAPNDVPAHIARTRHFAAARAGAPHRQPGFEKETFEAVSQIRRISADLGEPMATVALAWLNAQKGVASTIVGSDNPLQSRRNARAGNLMLPPGIVEQLSKITRHLRDRLGRSVDMWEVPPRFT